MFIIAYATRLRYNEAMLVVSFLTWWYGAGWKQRFFALREQIASTYDYFSIDLLVRTLFSPFRQISAGSIRGPLGVQIRAWFDRLISRTIGAIVRLIMIIVGAIALLLTTVLGGTMLLVWSIVPLLPAMGIIMTLSGWIPWKT